MARVRKTGASAPLREELADLKRERILKEAVGLFFERGYMQTTVEAIADKVGVTKPFIYAHFDSKTELLVEICERANRDALEVAIKADVQNLDPVGQLTFFVEGFTDVVLTQHAHVSIYFREQIHLPPADARRIGNIRKQIDRKLQDILARGKSARVFQFDDLAMCSLVIAGMLSYAFAWYREGGRLANDEIRAQMLVYVLRVVKADV